MLSSAISSGPWKNPIGPRQNNELSFIIPGLYQVILRGESGNQEPPALLPSSYPPLILFLTLTLSQGGEGKNFHFRDLQIKSLSPRLREKNLG